MKTLVATFGTLLLMSTAAYAWDEKPKEGRRGGSEIQKEEHRDARKDDARKEEGRKEERKETRIEAAPELSAGAGLAAIALLAGIGAIASERRSGHNPARAFGGPSVSGSS